MSINCIKCNANLGDISEKKYVICVDCYKPDMIFTEEERNKLLAPTKLTEDKEKEKFFVQFINERVKKYGVEAKVLSKNQIPYEPYMLGITSTGQRFYIWTGNEPICGFCGKEHNDKAYVIFNGDEAVCKDCYVKYISKLI